MLTLTIPGVESFDNDKQMFVMTDDFTLSLEHSLVSLSKWESRFEKPFISDEKKSTDEVYAYVQAMSLETDIPVDVLYRLTDDNVKELNEYIEAKMTATWFNETGQKKRFNREVVTSEIIYHWMVSLQIPWEAQFWHLNRLITLIKTINEKNIEASSKNDKKAPTRADLDARRALNEKRRREAGL